MIFSPEVRGYYCSDIDNIQTWEPDNIDEFNFFLDIYIGYKGREGSDYYTVNVAGHPQ